VRARGAGTALLCRTRSSALPATQTVETLPSRLRPGRWRSGPRARRRRRCRRTCVRPARRVGAATSDHHAAAASHTASLATRARASHQGFRADSRGEPRPPMGMVWLSDQTQSPERAPQHCRHGGKWAREKFVMAVQGELPRARGRRSQGDDPVPRQGARRTMSRTTRRVGAGTGRRTRSGSTPTRCCSAPCAWRSSERRAGSPCLLVYPVCAASCAPEFIL